MVNAPVMAPEARKNLVVRAFERMDRLTLRTYHEKGVPAPSLVKKEAAESKLAEPEAKEEQKAEVSRARKVARTFVEMIKKFNPIYIAKRVRDDIGTVREARQISKTVEPESTKTDVILSRTNLKMLGGLCISEIVGTIFCAPSFGTFLQYITHNAYMGVVGNIIGDYFPAVVSFQAAWLALNWNYYSNCADTLGGKIKRFYKDILPLHGIALLASIPAYAGNAAVSSGIIAGINAIAGGLAHKLPMPIIVQTINFAVGETIYLALVLGAAYETIVQKIAGRYGEHLKKEEQKAQTVDSA